MITSQEQQDDTICFLGVFPWVSVGSGWDEIWQNASDKRVVEWLHETAAIHRDDDVCCTNVSSCIVIACNS